MGHLDQETLCTARLVSKTFCAAASAHVCSLTLESTSTTSVPRYVCSLSRRLESTCLSFHRFPHLRHVTVSHRYWETLREESLAQLNPRLWDLATALTIKQPATFPWVIRDYLSQAALMPKLRKLTVEGPLEHEAALLARCTNLEAIEFRGCSISVARTIVTMHQLTSLGSVYLLKDPSQAVSAHISWLGHATNLRNLQALRISIPGEALPLIGNLTSLTGLTLVYVKELEKYSLAPLTGLTRLRSFGSGSFMEMTESNLGMACSLGSGSLVSLELSVYKEALAVGGRFLSRQTALTRLSLEGQQLRSLQPIGALRLELLQCLKINSYGALEVEGLSLLCRATSLSTLGIKARITQPLIGLSQVLARLTQLRSLSLKSYQYGPTKILDVPLASSALTGLTKLKMVSLGLDGGDFGTLLGLTGLRVLELDRCGLTDGMLPQLAVLTNLNRLMVGEPGITCLAPVSKVLDPLRKARGLPPLCISVVMYS